MLRKNASRRNTTPTKVKRIGKGGEVKRVGACPLVCGSTGIYLTNGKYGPYVFCGMCDYKCNSKSKGSDCQACGYDTTGTIAEGIKDTVDVAEGKLC